MAQRPLVKGRKGEAPLVHARLVSGDFERLTQAAKATGRTRSELIRQAVDRLLDEIAAEHPMAS